MQCEDRLEAFLRDNAVPFQVQHQPMAYTAQEVAALGAKEVRLAQEQELAATFPDCQVGAMPPFGNLDNVSVYVDRVLADDDTIVFRAGTHTDTLSLKYADFERLVKPTVADLARG